MSRIKFSLTEDEGQAVLDGGPRFWFLKGRIFKKSGPWRKWHTPGKKYKEVHAKEYPDCVVFCEAIKVNKFTVVLRLPDGNKPKMRLEQVLIPDEVQEKTRDALFSTGDVALANNYNNKVPFFTMVKINEGEEDESSS